MFDVRYFGIAPPSISHLPNLYSNDPFRLHEPSKNPFAIHCIPIQLLVETPKHPQAVHLSCCFLLNCGCVPIDDAPPLRYEWTGPAPPAASATLSVDHDGGYLAVTMRCIIMHNSTFLFRKVDVLMKQPIAEASPLRQIHSSSKLIGAIADLLPWETPCSLKESN